MNLFFLLGSLKLKVICYRKMLIKNFLILFIQFTYCLIIYQRDE